MAFSLAFWGGVENISSLCMEAQTESTDSYLKVMQWMHDRRRPLLIGGGVVVLIAVVWMYSAWDSDRKEADANSMFFNVPLENIIRSTTMSPDSFMQVTRDYPNTSAGEHALALAGEQLFLAGKYDEAEKAFAEFINNYPDSALVPQAKVGVAASLEAEGKSTEAIAKYHEIISLYPTELSIISPAKLTLARLLEENNQLQEAFRYYVELGRELAQNPNDPWAAEARERAQLMASKHPELLKDLTSSAPSVPQSGFTLSNAPPRAPAKPQPAPTSGHEGLNLLTIPGASSNSNGKP